MLRGERWRQEQRHRLAIIGAWSTAALVRRDPRKRLPPLSRLLPNDRADGPQTPEETVHHLKDWVRAAFRQNERQRDPSKRLDIRIGRLKEPIDFRNPPKVLYA